MAELECDCCCRDATSEQDFLCQSCARSSIYLMRLETSKILLDKESLEKQIESATKPILTGHRSSNHAQIAWRNEIGNAEKLDTRYRTQETRSHIQTMRQEIESMREEIAKRKADMIDRRKSLSAIQTAVPPRQQSTMSSIEDLRSKGTLSFNNLNSRLSSTKAFLCRETASLLRLRPKRRLKDGVITEQYTITGVLLPDLRDINTIRCIDLSAALNGVAHLLTLVVFYLGIRLPAEITVQHRNYPLATINTPANSYLGLRVPFPGSGSITTAPSSPFSSKHDIKGTHRPRPLFIGSDDRDEKVAQFAKRDPSAFNFFIEGISLLAWDVAWLCRTQGFTSGTTSWEHVCNMGRNLSTLLATPQSAAMQRVLSDRDNRKKKGQSQSPPATSNRQPTTTTTPVPNLSEGKLASTSHHTSHSASLLTLPANLDNIKTWKLSKHQLISDALKKHLLTEMNNAEWELLEEQEWDDGGELLDGAVAKPRQGTDDLPGSKNESIQTAPVAQPEQNGIGELSTQQDTGAAVKNPEGNATLKSKGGSGWTKLRGRDK